MALVCSSLLKTQDGKELGKGIPFLLNWNKWGDQAVKYLWGGGWGKGAEAGLSPDAGTANSAVSPLGPCCSASLSITWRRSQCPDNAWEYPPTDRGRDKQSLAMLITTKIQKC